MSSQSSTGERIRCGPSVDRRNIRFKVQGSRAEFGLSLFRIARTQPRNLFRMEMKEASLFLSSSLGYAAGLLKSVYKLG